MSTANTHAHHPAQAHHFRDLEQQVDAAKLGVWIFLCTEILMFGGLFVGYIIFHNLYPKMFAEGASHLAWQLGALNTVVLLGSSFTMAAGVHYAQTKQKQKCIQMLAITVLCGLGFMVVKFFEYKSKFHHGFLPGNFFTAENVENANLALYYGFYFLMTGLHGSHVLVGMGLIIWIMIRASKNEFDDQWYAPVEGVGLFWHLVDLIWIYLFPLLYLVG